MIMCQLLRVLEDRNHCPTRSSVCLSHGFDLLTNAIILIELFVYANLFGLNRVYALTKEMDAYIESKVKKSDAAALLKEKDEIINQVMAEGVECTSESCLLSILFVHELFNGA
ncbi:Golgin candidate 5 [Camellia lanceoleosa]|uniref:Golgin candidate 5 n=1 Tax=Camellia lanceoleosa TaxID=1840588 RepID=A0ACC0GCI3_9ERIC|nr:Golgin candidate 5 [Camellia lanceoleosa]